MPELPEVETIKRQLEERIVGVEIKEIEVLNPKSFIGNKQEVVSKRIIRLFRRGKMMVWELSNESRIMNHESRIYLVFRLGMSGQILYGESRSKNHELWKDQKHNRVIFDLNDGLRVVFRDVRKFGRIVLYQKSKIKNQKYISKIKNNLLSSLGIEPLSDDFNVGYLRNILQKSKKPIKIFLMEQDKICGIGNIYANEALFEAGVRPTRLANSLSPKETEKLYNSIRKVLSEGIEHQGSSIRDKSYINALGEIGSHQYHLKVYQRDGKECLGCGGIIKRIVVGQRGTFFCHKCQK